MDRLVEYLGGPDATRRATAIMTLVIGTIFGRYIMIAIDKIHPWWKSKEYARFGWSLPRLKHVRLPV